MLKGSALMGWYNKALPLWNVLVMILLLNGGWVAEAASLPTSCQTTPAVETEGYRRLALLVGVGTYKSTEVKTLLGPAHDIENMQHLLAGDGGYGFPKANLCILRDEEATLANFKTAFEEALVKRAKPNDVVVIYFTGHGSTIKDDNGDEADGNDETLILHDSRTNGTHDLRDDEFNHLLETLHHRTQRITVILDSCNSGTAVRADATSLTARYQNPESMAHPQASDSQADKPDGSPTFTPVDLPGLVVLTAAVDGTSAMDAPTGGIFTTALVNVLKEAPKPPLTYDQAAYQVRPLVAAQSSQIIHFQGEISRTVFENEHRAQAMGLRVSALGPELTLSGPPLPGLGVNAEMRVYHGTALGPETQDPKKAKATVVITSSKGLSATARVATTGPNKVDIQLGDIAVLVRPADDKLRLLVRLRDSRKPGGIPVARANGIRNMINDDPEKKAMVVLVDDDTTPADFELSLEENGQIVSRDVTNRIRNRYQTGATEAVLISQSLWQHARQIALKELKGEGGADFKNDETLQISLEPAPESEQLPCARGAEWRPAKPNDVQEIPLCYRYRIKVTSRASVPLLVGGAILSSDGGIFGFADMLHESLGPRQSKVLNKRFRAEPPLDIQDHIIVFGTQEKNPIQWELLTSPVNPGAKGDERRRGPDTSSLGRALQRYFVPGTRGVADDTAVEDSTWTRSSMAIVTRANSGFLAPPAAGKSEAPLDKKEYTLQHFDIRPYLPDVATAPLSRVLHVADSLAKYSQQTQDGVGYLQHPWAERTDADNLKKGIDCSRAIWFAFTRAGLPYNKQGDAYVSTADMVRPTGPMSDHFVTCPAESVKLGDVLVYRDDTRGDGHTVMVIDPTKRIAWGSHGWDGNVKEGKPPDTGVEYQLIKYKKDWERWDRSTMAMRACWRYKQIATDMTTSRGTPGTQAVNAACDQQTCRLNDPPDPSFMKAIQMERK